MKNNLFYNLFNPPAELREGQLWKLRDSDFTVMLTDTAYTGSIDVVRGLIISPITSLSDGGDILFGPNQSGGVTPGERIALRVTDGPLHISSLQAFLGVLPKTLISRIKKTLKNHSYNYLDFEEEQIAEILDILSKFRTEAVQLFERKGESGATIFTLPNVAAKKYDEVYPLRTAASDADFLKKEEEFWDVERIASKHSFLVYSDQNTTVRLTPFGSRLLFVCLSDKVKNVSGIQFSDGKSTIKAADPKLSIGNSGRNHTYIDPKLLRNNKWEISFSLDKKKIAVNVEIK